MKESDWEWGIIRKPLKKLKLMINTYTETMDWCCWKEERWAMARPPVPRCRGESGSIDELYTTGLFLKISCSALVLSERSMSKPCTWTRQPGCSRIIKIEKGWKEQWQAGMMELFCACVISSQSHNITAPGRILQRFLWKVRGHDSTNCASREMWRWVVRTEERNIQLT